MPRIFDNVADVTRLGPALMNSLEKFESVDVATGYLDLRGWGSFAPGVETKPRPEGRATARILVGMVSKGDSELILEALQSEVQPQFGTGIASQATALQAKQHLVMHLRTQLMRGLADHEARKALRQLAGQLREGKVEMRVFTRAPLHGKTYLFHQPGDTHLARFGYVGSSNLTSAGLYSNLELNIDVVDDDATAKLEEWFNERWSDKFSLNITEEIIELIEESWAGEQPTPFEVYLKVCHSLSEDARAGMGYVLPHSMRKLLLDHQETAVRTLARRLVRRGGTMLGDVVGLGKTLTAVATAQMLQAAHDYTTLVLCPKNLKKMWEEHLEAYEITGTVVTYPMADKHLPELRRYHLVICDESHNLRNTGTKAHEAIHDYVRRNDSKVLLLTATPYNLAFSDVAGQIGLYLDDDDDLGIVPTEALKKTPQLADKLDGKINTLAAFRQSEEPDDWRRLMSDHLIRRTRSFVRKTAQKDSSGREYLTFADGDRFYFPDRVPRPLIHHFADNDPAAAMESEETLQRVGELLLPRYRLADYDNPKAMHTPEDRKVIDDISAGRGNVSGFVRTGLYKRLSSSGHSFILSLKRQRSRNELYIYAIDNQLKLPVGSFSSTQLSLTDEDLEAGSDPGSMEQRYLHLEAAAPAGTRWINSTVFKPSLRADLAHDVASLTKLLDSFGQWDMARDSKINSLVDLLTTTHAGEKVLVFTEYKDTANYIAEALMAADIPAVGVATGDSEDPSSLGRRFSPVSNALPGQEATLGDADELNVLVATDVLSEGQNLQDAHIIVNYDLPWAIIRLIQRAGRVDRVGQKSDTVYVYTVTHENIEAQLNLRQRIRQRLKNAAIAFGSDEKFFGTEGETHLIEGLYSGQMPEEAGEEGEGEADAVSEAWRVWNKAQDTHPEIVKRVLQLPDMVHSTRAQYAYEHTGGVTCFVSTVSGVDAFATFEDHPGGQARQRLLTPLEAMQRFAAEPTTPTAAEREDHLQRQADLVQQELTIEATQAGNLKGIRKWAWQKLSGTFDAAAAGEGLNMLYERPLTEHARARLSAARRGQWDPADVAAEISRLHEEERLVIKSNESDAIRLVCSMGVRN